VKIEGLG